MAASLAACHECSLSCAVALLGLSTFVRSSALTCYHVKPVFLNAQYAECNALAPSSLRVQTGMKNKIAKKKFFSDVASAH